mmetsp:Transcript_74229/g.131081  ORF Transcript_74229/g.131081 Transcript_74229/m.131081 type:complete len:226 (-) Transcript_74229:449-1126(-)
MRTKLWHARSKTMTALQDLPQHSPALRGPSPLHLHSVRWTGESNRRRMMPAWLWHCKPKRKRGLAEREGRPPLHLSPVTVVHLGASSSVSPCSALLLNNHKRMLMPCLLVVCRRRSSRQPKLQPTGLRSSPSPSPRASLVGTEHQPQPQPSTLISFMVSLMALVPPCSHKAGRAPCALWRTRPTPLDVQPVVAPIPTPPGRPPQPLPRSRQGSRNGFLTHWRRAA